MTIQDKIHWMESIRGKNHPLSQFQVWLDRYLPSYHTLKLIQVGGTNGKGSTCQWLNLILEKEGYKVGLFTSPHLVSHSERIRINGIDISEKDWERIFDQYFSFFEQEHLTMFEMDLFIAIAYFLEQKIEIGIIEVGMGGRLDATTALDYIATLITNIGKDHMEYLGSTLPEIAKEKAGIFKKDTLALVYDTTYFSVMEQVAFEHGTSLLAADHDLSRYDISKLPKYQIENLVLALSALEELHLLKPAVVQDVIDTFTWEGRFTVLRENPLLIVDGAHNVPGMLALIRSLKDFHGVIYFSALKEKETQAMIELLLQLDQELVLVEFESERLCDLEQLAKRFHLKTISFEEMKNQLENTEKNALICGSLYFIGEVIGWKKGSSKKEALASFLLELYIRL